MLWPPKADVTHVRTNDSARLPITMFPEKQYIILWYFMYYGGPPWFFPTASTSTKPTAPQNWFTQLTRQADENQHFRHHVRVVRVT